MPRLAAGQRFEVTENRPLALFREAQAVGTRTRPILLGPVSFLLLAKAVDGSDPLDLLAGVLALYARVLRELAEAGCAWVQMDEPCLALNLPEKARVALALAYGTLAKSVFILWNVDWKRHAGQIPISRTVKRRTGSRQASARLALPHGPMQDIPVQRPSTASCFAIFLLPHVLFVADFEERERIARVCCLAWNIALFADAGERESHVESNLDLLLDDGDAPPHGLRQRFGEELRMLAGLKRDLFQWQLANVLRADLEPGPDGIDVLSVDADGAVERVELALSPPITGLPRITKVLVQIRKDTKAQRRTLEEARTTPGLVEHVVTRDMLTAYCAQRADLRSYHRRLAAWSEASSEPELISGIGRFLLAVDEIEADTKAVLGILAAALGVSWEQ